MRPGGMFGRASSTIFTASEDRQGIMSVVVESGNMWIMANKTIQKWQMVNDGQRVSVSLRVGTDD